MRIFIFRASKNVNVVPRKTYNYGLE